MENAMRYFTGIVLRKLYNTVCIKLHNKLITQVDIIAAVCNSSHYGGGHLVMC